MTESVSTETPPPQMFKTADTGLADEFKSRGVPVVAETIKEAVYQALLTGTHGREIEDAFRTVVTFLCNRVRIEGEFSGEDSLLPVAFIYNSSPVPGASTAWFALRTQLSKQGVHILPRAYTETQVQTTRRCWFCRRKKVVPVTRLKFLVIADRASETAYTAQLDALRNKTHDLMVNGIVRAMRLEMTSKQQTTHSIEMSTYPAFRAWRVLDQALLLEGVSLVSVKDGVRKYECVS